MKKSIFAIALAIILILSLALFTGCQDTSGELLERQDAKRIALERAGINEEDVWDLEVDLDKEWGVLLYEVSFDSGTLEYEYKIDAHSGKILSERTERDR